MTSNKRDRIINFTIFLENLGENGSGSCAFDLLDGTTYQGWIDEVKKDTILFYSSGPLAQDEPITVDIANINTDMLYYYDKQRKKWRSY